MGEQMCVILLWLNLDWELTIEIQAQLSKTSHGGQKTRWEWRWSPLCLDMLPKRWVEVEGVNQIRTEWPLVFFCTMLYCTAWVYPWNLFVTNLLYFFKRLPLTVNCLWIISKSNKYGLIVQPLLLQLKVFLIFLFLHCKA